MKRTVPPILFALPLALAGFATAAPPAFSTRAPSAAQDDEEKPDKREEVKELNKKLKDHAKARGKEDQEAIRTIDELIAEFEKSGPKDRASIAKEIGNCLKQKRKANKEGIRDNKLFVAAAAALGEMGPESTKILTGWIDHKDHDEDMALQSILIQSLGKTKDDDAVEPLVDLLKHHQSTMQSKAAEALGNFTHLELKERKEVFKEVLDQITAIKNRVDSNPNDTTARERYDAVRANMLGTLRAMSGQDIAQPNEWRSWWNNNKKKDWDDM